jgi:hypothetical protein
MTSFLYFNRNSNLTEEYTLTELTSMHMDIITSIPHGQISKTAFNASFYSVNNNLYVPENMKAIEKSFEFCNNCSIATFNMYDNINTYITDFFYSLKDGHCRDSVSSDQFDKLYENDVTPEALTENYYECYDNEFTATFDSVGIAAGNVGLMLPFIVLALLPIIFLYLKSIGYTPPKIEYKKSEVEDYMFELGVQLLRARDGKTRGWTKRNKNLAEIAESLAVTSLLSGAFPDSDDESSEEDDDDDDDDEKYVNESNNSLQYFVNNSRDSNDVSSKTKKTKKPTKIESFGIEGIEDDKKKVIKEPRLSKISQVKLDMVKRQKSFKTKDKFSDTNPLHLRTSKKQQNSMKSTEIIVKSKFLNDTYPPLLETLTIERSLFFVQSVLNDLEKSFLLKNELQKMLKMNKILILTGNLKILDIYNGDDSDDDDNNNNEDIRHVREIFVIICKIMQYHISIEHNDFNIELNNSLLTDKFYYNIGGKDLNGMQIIKYSL